MKPSGLEDIFGKLMSEDMLKSLVQGVKEGMTETKPSNTDDWCHVNGNKPVTSWIIVRVTLDSSCDFTTSVLNWKKKLALFLKNLPEGKGLMFLPDNFEIDTFGDK